MKRAIGVAFNAAPFGQPLDGEVGLVWEDPREVHRVVVRFQDQPPANLGIQYWRTRWPQQRLPKGEVPRGGASGWWELGNWFTGQWQTADATLDVREKVATFAFRPVNKHEFPDLNDFAATYRTTLKLRLIADQPLPQVEAMEAYTDSTCHRLAVTVLWASSPQAEPSFKAFNGHVDTVQQVSPEKHWVGLWRTDNDDPNTFDKTLLTIQADETVTVSIEDVCERPVYVPDYGMCVVAGEVERDYGRVGAEVGYRATRSRYELVAELPEQSWSRAWRQMVPKRERFYLPLGRDGGRHHFGVNPDGSIFWRTSQRNERYLRECPGQDTPRLQADGARIDVSFDLPQEPRHRTIQDGTLPISIAEWQVEGALIRQVAFTTVLGGTNPLGPAPAGDAFGICMARFAVENRSEDLTAVRLPLQFSAGGQAEEVTVDADGLIWAGERLRGQVCVDDGGRVEQAEQGLRCWVELAPRAIGHLALKLPYVWLQGDEIAQLKALDFDREHAAVADYWRRRLDSGMRLLTPERMLNDFHRAHAAHLLINCEREPGAERRFARVGSLSYGAFGNESCMMIVDLDRRGYHRAARECLEAFLRYQGTVPLPGDFSSHEGVLYGASGYESGGYNQHHGWILWCLIEHFKYTRDRQWLRGIAPNVVAAADWIIRERGRVCDQDYIGRDLLPHGALEDIGDWWQWLSTNAYTWRGLDAAAWGWPRSATHVLRRCGARRTGIGTPFCARSGRRRSGRPWYVSATVPAFRTFPLRCSDEDVVSAGCVRPWKVPSTCW